MRDAVVVGLMGYTLLWSSACAPRATTRYTHRPKSTSSTSWFDLSGLERYAARAAATMFVANRLCGYSAEELSALPGRRFLFREIRDCVENAAPAASSKWELVAMSQTADGEPPDPPNIDRIPPIEEVRRALGFGQIVERLSELDAAPRDPDLPIAIAFFLRKRAASPIAENFRKIVFRCDDVHGKPSDLAVECESVSQPTSTEIAAIQTGNAG